MSEIPDKVLNFENRTKKEPEPQVEENEGLTTPDRDWET